MNSRRQFFSVLAGGVGGLLLPRKVEAQSSDSAIDDEQMATVIAEHRHNVVLYGSSRFFGQTRRYHYADELPPMLLDWDGKPYHDHDHKGPWSITGDVIACSSPCDGGWRVHRISSGSLVEVRHYDIRLPERQYRISYEEQYDISNPDLLVAHLIVYPTNDKAQTFARVQGSWLELGRT